jgi:predicted nucleic acid-binding protein
MKSALDEIEETSEVVLDASVVINLLGTGVAKEILTAFEFKCTIDKLAAQEIVRHPRPDGDLKKELGLLAREDLIREVRLSDAEYKAFLELVGAPSPSGLGDGEAATLVQAVSLRAVAVIDERKAKRIAAARYPGLKIASTTDILFHRSVMSRLGENNVAAAITDARRHARMFTSKECIAWLMLRVQC